MAKKDLKKISIILVIFVIVALPPFVKYQRLLYKNRELDSQIRALKEKSKRLDAEKSRLERDISYIEKKAREKIGVVRKGEIVLREPGKKE